MTRISKKFFQRKEALAGILLNVVPEFRQLSHAEVMDRIISSEVNSDYAELFSTEDVEQNQTVIYDVVVRVAVNYQERDVHLIFDLEMQRKFKPNYPLFNRMIYDTSRIISKQKIKKANYKELIPVQSTWICVKNVPKELENRAFHFEFSAYEDFRPAEVDRSYFDGIDLVRMDLILLSEGYDWDYNDPQVIKFLQSIFHNNMKSTMFNPYVTMDESVEKEVEAIMRDNDLYEADMRAERRDGEKIGEERDRERINTLNNLLIEAGRLDDLQRSTKDREFQEELLKEFGL